MVHFTRPTPNDFLNEFKEKYQFNILVLQDQKVFHIEYGDAYPMWDVVEEFERFLTEKGLKVLYTLIYPKITTTSIEEMKMAMIAKS